MTLPPLLPESYWVVRNKLLAGFYSSSLDIEALIVSGIRHVVNLMVDHYARSYEKALAEASVARGADLTMKQSPVQDFGVPSLTLVKETLGDIDAQIVARRPVYIHCWAGRRRTEPCWVLPETPRPGLIGRCPAGAPASVPSTPGPIA